MNDRRWVYYINCGHLHCIIEESFQDPKFSILSDFQKESLRTYLLQYCSGIHYNQHRIHYFIRKGIETVEKRYPCSNLVNFLVQKLTNTSMAIGNFTAEEYQQLIIDDYKHQMRIEETATAQESENCECKCENMYQWCSVK